MASGMRQLLRFQNPDEGDELEEALANHNLYFGQLGAPKMRNIGGGQLMPIPLPRQATPLPPLPFPQPRPQIGGVEDEIGALLSRPPSRMPGPPPMFPQLAARPQQTTLDLIPQLLAGAGDAIMGGRTSYLGQTMGLQERLREQRHRDVLEQAARAWDARSREHDFDRWRYGQEETARAREFDRAMKLKEFGLFEKRLGGLQSASTEQMTEAKLQQYKAALSKVAGRKELRYEADKLRTMNPADKTAIDEVERMLQAFFALEESQPNLIREQLEATVGRGPAGWIGGQLDAMTEPHQGRGFGIFNAPRGYRWAHAVPGLGTLGAGALDLAELFGIADFSGSPVRLPAPTVEDQRLFEEALQRKRRLQQLRQQQELAPATIPDYWTGP